MHGDRRLNRLNTISADRRTDGLADGNMFLIISIALCIAVLCRRELKEGFLVDFTNFLKVGLVTKTVGQAQFFSFDFQ